ncbi:glyoxalase [Rhodobacterales bacterium HKCCSP123]|nr:glyoxalase [Rhodobacterales bacterium HKCCSP123]
MTQTYIAPAGTRIGHVHLKVSDLERSIAFYRDVIGLEVMQRYGAQAAFLSAGGYHHHLGLNTWESAGGPRPPRNAVGLYHTAFLYPDREGLARAFRRAVEAGVEIEGAADHGVSEAIYFSDPDGNGIELYRDRAPEDWPRDAEGQLQMVNARLNLDALLEMA